MSDVTILATGLGFPEGPVVCPDGSVVLTEIRHGRCTRVFSDGSTRVFSHTGGGPNGLAIGPDGAFYLCNNGGSRYVAGTSMGQGPHPDYTGGSIQRLDPHTGARTTLTACNGTKLSAPNDLVFDGHGGFYFTDLGKRYARHRDHGGGVLRLAGWLEDCRARVSDVESQWLWALSGWHDALCGGHRRGAVVGL